VGRYRHFEKSTPCADNRRPKSVTSRSLSPVCEKLELSPKPAHKPEWVTRADFYAEMLATRERINAPHLAILDKLDTNHRELLAALERQASRINALESGLARVDERTRK
jgi:hypothetical protein